MKRVVTRIIGIALIVAGIAGLVFSVAGLVVLARVEKQVNVAVQRQVETLDQALTATAEGLALAENSLTQVQDTVDAIQSTVRGLGQAIDDTSPTLTALGNLVGKQLPATITAAENSLRSAQRSARVLDGFLSVISAVPLFGNSRYNPDVPLNERLGEVAASLEGVPASLEDGGSGIFTTVGSLGTIKANVDRTADSIGEINTSLESAKTVVANYQGVLASIGATLERVRNGLATWLRLIRWGFSLMLIWLGIVQFALITQGFELIGRSRPKPEPDTGDTPTMARLETDDAIMSDMDKIAHPS